MLTGCLSPPRDDPQKSQVLGWILLTLIQGLWGSTSLPGVPVSKNQVPSAFDPTQFSSAEDSQPVCMLPDSTMRQFPVCMSVLSRKRKKSFRAAQDSSPWFTHGVPHKERRVCFLGMGGKPGGRSHEHPFLRAHPCHP